ncbi:MAG: putative molybdenum transporter, solute-binding protein [Anaerospora sp.]|jgi:molybdate transport system substrate-binding protein|nr:putative molybdenum transporter, solute-binding protein [Anaerospora sp.]
MGDKKEGLNRRSFLKAGIASLAVASAVPGLLYAGRFQADSLQVWSCGGLSEAFMEANNLYEQRNGIQVNYTGAFAAALGKSLIGGAVTEIFAGRVLQLAKTLRADNKMLYFRPLCFTDYVLITPLDNPAGIQSVQDLARPGVKVIFAAWCFASGRGRRYGYTQKSKH